MKRRGWLVATVVVLSALSVGGMAYAATVEQAGVAGTPSQQGSQSTNHGMMGNGGSTGYGGMMGNGGTTSGGGMMGYMNAQAPLDSHTQVSQLIRVGERGAVLNRQKNTITYSGKSIDLVALASPHGKPNMTWEIDGMVNPTVIIPPHATIQVTLVNTDWGYMHGFEVTATAPPYSYMSMMDVNSDFLLMPLPERTTKSLTTAEYFTRSGHLHLSAGTYHYLCPMPGHAQQGMYGTLKIE